MLILGLAMGSAKKVGSDRFIKYTVADTVLLG